MNFDHFIKHNRKHCLEAVLLFYCDKISYLFHCSNLNVLYSDRLDKSKQYLIPLTKPKAIMFLVDFVLSMFIFLWNLLNLRVHKIVYKK